VNADDREFARIMTDEFEMDFTGFDPDAPEDDDQDNQDETEPDDDLDDRDGISLPDWYDSATDDQRWEWDNPAPGDVTRREARIRRQLGTEWRDLHPNRVQGNARPASSWDDVPLDGILDRLAAGTLVLPSPTVGMLADGSAGLFYPGRVNGLAGESGAGKGWIALVVCIEQMRAGQDSFYLDFEDSPALVVLRLVTVLGVDPQLVRDHFHYVHPAKHDEAEIAALVDRVSGFPGALVVIDSTGESIAAAGLNQNHDEEVAAWFQSLAHPLADKASATVMLIDHMVKAEDGGLWPIGSQRKRAAITGAQYVAEVAQPFSKDADGMVVLKVAKDRHGTREARSVASYVQFVHEIVLVLEPDGSTAAVMTEDLSVFLGPGKTVQQVQADRDARAAKQLDSDVAEIDRMNPKPTNYRDVKTRLSWNDKRSQAAMREWKARQKP